MKNNVKVFKYLPLALLFAAQLALANTQEVTKAEKKKSDSVWGGFVDSIRAAKLKQKIDLPSFELFRGVEIGAGYTDVSDPSVAGNYSGIDIWEIKAGVDSRIFNYDLPVNIGASASKKITYIQQFQTRRESILRLPYDPITKIPREAADFYRKNDGEYVFKVGDFIGYKIPLVFEVSGNLLEELLTNAHITGGYRYFLGGEFDIQIFRMASNLIRVKIIAVNDRNHGWFGGIKVFGFDPLTSKIGEQLLDDRIYQGATSNRTTDLYIGDYVLNLDSAEARSLYDSIIAQKMKIFNADMVREYLSATQFIKDRTQFNENLFADLQRFNAVASADKDLPNNKKRVIKIINAENHTESDEDSNKFNFLRIFKFEHQDNETDADIAIVGESLKDKDNFALHSTGDNSKFSWLDNWKKEKRSQLNLLFSADKEGKKTDIVGIHLAKMRKHYSLSQKRYMDFYEKTAKHAPESIKSVIKFPHQVSRLRDKYHNIFINYEVYATNKIFELNKDLPRSLIESKLAQLMKEITSLDGVRKKEKDFVVNKLTELFSTTTDLDTKYKIFDELTESSDMFSDFGSVIILNVIQESTIAECILVQLSYSSHESGSAVLKYPSISEFNKINLFRNIIEQNDYILDRSYNLRNFLKEDGNPYSLEELILKNAVIRSEH